MVRRAKTMTDKIPRTRDDRGVFISYNIENKYCRHCGSRNTYVDKYGRIFWRYYKRINIFFHEMICNKCYKQYYGKHGKYDIKTFRFNPNSKIKPEAAKKVGNALRGRKRGRMVGPITEKSRQMRSASLKQFYNNNPERRLENSQRLRGSNGSNWKGGKTQLNELIRHSLRYSNWRKAVFDRDHYICQECNKKPQIVNVHHVKEFYKIVDEYNIKTFEDALNCEILWDVCNGKTLCLNCHDKTKNGRI